MTNTMQLAQRLLKGLKVKSLGLVSVENSLDILDAINGAIQEFYVLCPSAYKRTQCSGFLAAPQTVYITVTNGSNVFSGYTPASTLYGSSIVIQTDTRQNTIASVSTLLDIYTGVTGVQQAIVYNDVIQLDAIVQRLTSDPVLVDFNQILIRDENYKRRGGQNWSGDQVYWYPGTAWNRSVGCPRYYWMEATGQVQNAVIPFLARVNTLPDQLYRLRVEADLAPTPLQFQDLVIPNTLALDPYSVEMCVLPMALGRLTSSPLWDNEKLIPAALNDAQMGRRMASERPSNPGAARNRVRTPAGW